MQSSPDHQERSASSQEIEASGQGINQRVIYIDLICELSSHGCSLPRENGLVRKSAQRQHFEAYYDQDKIMSSKSRIDIWSYLLLLLSHISLVWSYIKGYEAHHFCTQSF